MNLSEEINNPIKIELSIYELNTILLYAFRYAINRHTYALEEAVDLIIKYKPYLEDHIKTMMIRETETEIKQDCQETGINTFINYYQATKIRLLENLISTTNLNTV